MISISVVIPTIRGESIRETIKGILTNSILPAEIIIVDQANSLTSEFFCQFNTDIQLKLIKDEGKGAGRARNIGWKASIGNIIAFIDDDAIPSKIWIESIVNSYKENHKSVGMIGGKVTPVYTQRNPDWQIPEEFQHMLPSYNQGENKGLYINGALPASVNMIIPRFLLEKTEGFNERLGTNKGKKIQIFGEDAELALRVKEMGFKLIYNPDVEVFHPVPLERQNETFFKKRIFIEGYTIAYLDCNMRQYSFTNKLYIIYNELKKQSKLIFIKGNNTPLCKGKLNYSKGYLSGIIRFGFFN